VEADQQRVRALVVGNVGEIAAVNRRRDRA
jgi:hypothetical protein